VRQAVFSIVSHTIPGAFVLDLYAGTGAMGIEALSRGAAKAVFVESSAACIRAIWDNLERTGMTQKGAILKGDALKVLASLGRQKEKFDVVIADPPYASLRVVGGEKKERLHHEEHEGHEGDRGRNRSPLAEMTLKILLESGILKADSLIILEHAVKGCGLDIPDGLTVVSVRKYGDTAVSILHPSPRR
jgi:16S rRNA G966 N2-methylase RsmD